MVSALMMLIVAVAVFFTFAIGQRVREKTKLQAVADAQAYSAAVAEARAMNYYAFSNRAIVAHDVSVLAVHAHQSFLSWYEDMLKGEERVFLIMMGIFIGECACCLAPPCPMKCLCPACPAVNRARKIAKMWKDEHKKFHDKWHKPNISRADQVMSLGSASHFALTQAIFKQQQAVHLQLQRLFDKLPRDVAGQVDSEIRPSRLAALYNIDSYCHSECIPRGSGPVAPHPSVAEDWLEILYGTRYPGWITNRGMGPSPHYNLYRIRTMTMCVPVFCTTNASNQGNAKTLERDPGTGTRLASDVHRGGHGRTGFGGGLGFAAEDHGSETGFWYAGGCAFAGGFYRQGAGRNAIWTDPDDSGGGASHKHGFHMYEGSKRVEKDNRFKHGLGGCDRNGNCGIYAGHMRYAMQPERNGGPDSLWRQPRVVAIATKPTSSIMQPNGRFVPWAFKLNTSFPPVKLDLRNGQGDQDAGSTMAAMAGALVYYHKPLRRGGDNWQEPPSLWNPFWRAKLHPVPLDRGFILALTGSHSASATALPRLLPVTPDNAVNF